MASREHELPVLGEDEARCPRGCAVPDMPAWGIAGLRRLRIRLNAYATSATCELCMGYGIVNATVIERALQEGS